MNWLNQLGSSLARGIVRGMVRLYYGKIEITGREQIPTSGPVLFVANHANSLIDPVMIGITASRPVHFLAKAPLFEIPLFGSLLRALGMLPAYRGSDDPSQVGGNLKSLADSAAFMRTGECVGIFPEGKSHDALKVDKVRSGAARIAVQAVLQGTTNLMIVPLGINYQRKERFRSAVWLRVGAPIRMEEWKEKIAQEERVAMRALTAEIDARLKSVVIHLNEEQWEPYLPELEVLVPAAAAEQRSPIAALRQRKRLADAVNYFLEQDRLRAEFIAGEVKAHRANVERAGLEMQSDLFRLRYTRLFLRQTWDFIWLLFGFIPALAGTIYNLAPFLLVRAINAVLPKVNRSTVSLERLGFGLPLFGGWYLLFWFKLQPYFLPWVATAWSFLMIAAGIFALAYWPRAKIAAGLWWNELRMILQPRRLNELRAAHFALQKKFIGLAEEFRRVQPVDTIATPIPWLWWLKKVAAWTVFISAVGALAVFLFSKTATRPLPELAYGGPDLTRIAPVSLSAQLEADERALQNVIFGLRDLESRVLQIRTEFKSGKRDFYRQSDNDLIRQLMLSYANYRTALLRMVWKYQRNAELTDKAARLRSFLIAYSAGCVLYETSLKFIAYFQDSPEAVRKLNEAEPLWKIPPGLYNAIQRDLSNASNRDLFAEASADYQKMKPDFKAAGLWSGAPFAFFHQMIPESVAVIDELQSSVTKPELSVGMLNARDAGKGVVYRAKTVVSAWIGDTKIRAPREGKPLIQSTELHQFGAKLKPGDILLERRNWFLSNAFLPGYWPHSALYIGTAEDLQRMGLNRDPRVAKVWQKFIATDPEGHRHVIIESVSEGVVFSSLEHSIGGADSVAALRPRLSEATIREAIARAFSHVGKPYDFEFDFFSTDKLVCTELVFRSYDGDIEFPLSTILGTKTLPAIEMVRKFTAESGKPGAQLGFVAFLDGEESTSKAVFKDEAEFSRTIDRPALTWLQKQ